MLRIQSKFVPTYVNYAHYFQSKGDEKNALKIIEKGLQEVPESAGLYHVLGLWHIRQKEQGKALAALKHAAELDSDNARYQYVYAVALAEKDMSGAIAVLEASLKKHTGDIQTLYGLAYYYKQIGQVKQAEHYQATADRLSRFVPNIEVE